MTPSQVITKDKSLKSKFADFAWHNRSRAAKVRIAAAASLVGAAIVVPNIPSDANPFWVYSTSRSRICSIEDVHVKSYDVIDSKTGEKKQVSQFFIDTSDCGVFVNYDSFLKLKFRSADLQTCAATIKNRGLSGVAENKRAEFHDYGWRFGPFSWFPNATSIKPTNGDVPKVCL